LALQMSPARADPCSRETEIGPKLFDRRRDLFTELDLVFFDTTSIYFEGEGGQSVGQRGKSKDHRPDLKQMVVGAILDRDGRPICCEMWPGNTTDVKTLVPVIDRLRFRFHIRSVCIVADRGMISAAVREALQEPARGCHFILGARMRSVKRVRRDVLSRAGRYHVVHGARERSTDPSPLEVKEVQVDEERYIVCRNSEQARKDRADREAIVAALTDQLRQGDRALVGNRGYRKYLQTTDGSAFEIDEAKVQQEQRYDGKWVLQTDMDELTPAEVALRYKQLWMVEDVFRSMKSVLDTRPIYHKCDETIRGHVFCSFLALMLRHELQSRLTARGWHDVEWDRLKADLSELREVTVTTDAKRFYIRTDPKGDAGKAVQAARVALGPAVRLA